MLDRIGNNITLDSIFDEMYDLISEANRIPLTDKIIVEESDLAGILDDLKEAIPKEVKNASQVLDDQQNIVNKAREEADAIVEQAKAEADRILTMAKGEADRAMRQENIVQQAEAFAEDAKNNALRYQDSVKSEADAYAARVKTDSLQYADDMLGYLSNNLQSALNAISENRNNIDGERKDLEKKVAAAPAPEAIPEDTTAEEPEAAPTEETEPETEE
jgi:cell division septum initiation protein DivIVA